MTKNSLFLPFGNVLLILSVLFGFILTQHDFGLPSIALPYTVYGAVVGFIFVLVGSIEQRLIEIREAILNKDD